MKSTIALCGALALLFTLSSCNSGSADVEKQYSDLMTEHDSLVQVSGYMQDSLNEYKSRHQNLMQRLSSLDSVDTTFLENMAAHEAMLKQLEATMAGHDQLRQGHEDLKQNRSELSDQELKAQMEKMKAHHDQMMTEHNDMRNKFSTLRNEHNNLSQNLKERMNQSSDTTKS